ncbi:unnamed protein product [Rotaria sp. Silwood1]|nr:unnamed protein product [Rotaria sp. Silwood1]CAF4637001.1 unnamed protein product [Rotaria sp. Silwood1]CAF4770659.1 unnamed protein product [Rotaria sp. Silwood1]
MNVTLFRWLLIVVTKIIYFVDANWITGSNLCWSMPCMNGGSCFGSAFTYLCVCPINYSGALCEKRLGICQESPCGNRGLCVETSLTSFECRCYFDYMGPLCEEHVPKDDPSVWSSLIPVHTRVLFDILQEAYRVKAQGKSTITSSNGPIDFLDLLTTNGASSSSSFLSDTTSSTIVKSNFITSSSEITQPENIIRAEDIQLEKIFPKISTASTNTMYKPNFIEMTSQIFETTEPNNYSNETNITSSIVAFTIENITTTVLPPLQTVENMMTISLEQNRSNSLNITEDQEFINMTQQFNTMITSTPFEWLNSSSNNDTITGFTHELIQNSTEQNNNNMESNEFIINTTSQIIDYTLFETSNYSSIQIDNNQFNISKQTISSTKQSLTTDKVNDINNNSQNQLLYKLCQQLLSHILPNVSSLSSSSSSSAIEEALSLVSSSSSIGNNSVDELLTWIKEQLSSSTITTTSTTTTTAKTPSTLSSLLQNEKKLSTMSLQRVDMDDALHQMNNNMDGEQ